MTECEGYVSRGREPWVYPAEDPTELQGVHARLLADRVQPGETIHYMLYSPLWDGEKAPFGLRQQRASHALAVLADRLIVTRDEHSRRRPPTVFEIPFDAMLCFDLGTALLLGWLVVRYAEGASTRECTVFFQATGLEYFVEAFRRCRAIAGGSTIPAQHGSPAAVVEWENGPGELVHGIGRLLVEAETVQAALFVPSTRLEQARRWRRKRVMLTAPSLLVRTPLGLLQAQREEAPRNDLLYLGVNTLFVPEQALCGLAVITAKDSAGNPAGHLVIRIRRGAATLTKSILLHTGDHDRAADFVRASAPARAR